jgi:DNA-binding CsgD family transcriptional regulator
MPNLTRDSLQKVRGIEDSLAHYAIDGDNVQASIEALHELLATDKLLLFTLAQRPGGEDLVVARDASVGFPPDRWRDVFNEFLRGRGVTWGGYNALRPEPEQRDRVLSSSEVALVTDGRSRAAEEFLELRLGMIGHDRLRVLICDGPATLAWLGLFQAERATDEQRDVLERVVPAFRKRLLFERLIGEAALASSAVVATLESLSHCAWVLGTDGRIAHANTAGRAKFDGDAAGTRSALEACVAGNTAPRYRITPLRNGAGVVGHIVVELPDPAAAAQGVAPAARRFGLTPAQTRVLERVARGVSNATIAAELGVAERTVEAHVTAILVKAQVPSRAALIVQIFRERLTA